jgi:microcystin-dependent protein
VSAVTSTELGRLSGVTSSIQSQLDLKANLASPTFTGNVSLPSTTKVDGVTISSEFIPVGAVIPFAMNSTPAGWVTCNGAVVNRIGTYADLFNVIGTTYNIGGESSTQFRLPDLRGIFIRGSGSQTIDGTSYSATFGQTVKDAFQKFTGTLRIDSWMKGTGVFSENTTPSSYIDNTGATDTGSEVTFDPSTVARTSNETRPVNIALRYCIKF